MKLDSTIDADFDDNGVPGSNVSNAEAASASANLADVMSDCNWCV